VISAGAALGFYAGPLRDSVVALKYKGRHKTAGRLARRLFERPACRGLLDGAQLMVGIPLHPTRLRARGFNQAELLAGHLGRYSGIPVSAALVRSRDTASQTALSAPMRRRNVTNAFAVLEPARIRNLVVVLVDDVITTGATIRECASTLLGAGAREVRAITVARAE
jgi:competence protein ComFC